MLRVLSAALVLTCMPGSTATHVDRKPVLVETYAVGHVGGAFSRVTTFEVRVTSIPGANVKKTEVVVNMRESKKSLHMGPNVSMDADEFDGFAATVSAMPQELAKISKRTFGTAELTVPIVDTLRLGAVFDPSNKRGRMYVQVSNDFDEFDEEGWKDVELAVDMVRATLAKIGWERPSSRPTK
mgnify:CR=1 FL=1